MEDNEAVLPPKAREKLRMYMSQLQQMQQNANQYFLGIIDSMGLEGNWNLDVQRMVAVRQNVPETPKEET